MPFTNTSSNIGVPYYGGNQVNNAAAVFTGTSVPSTNLQPAIGSLFVNTSSGNMYGLVSLSGGSASWTLLGGASSAVATLTGDSGGAISPSSGNITLAGTANQITTTGSGSTITWSLPSAITAPGSILATTTVASTTTMTAGTGLTVTTGDLAISAGNANVTGNVVASKSAAGANVTAQVTNSDNTSGTSNAGVEIAAGGASGGDPYLSFQISGVGASTMTMGLDNSSSDTFVISNSGSIGTSNALTLTQAGALTASTTITATLGDITATNGNLVLGTAGNKIVSTSVASNTTAGANSFGTVTLVGGTATVSTTAVTASSIIYLFRQGVGATGAAALGILSVGTITASTSFVINAVQAADATSLQASDVSVIGWMIVN